MRLITSLLGLLVAMLAHPVGASATTFGAGVGGDFVNQTRNIWSAAQTEANLQSLYAAGGRVGRADANWGVTEPARPARHRASYDWTYDDMLVSEMAQAHLSWQPTLDDTPRWAQQRGSNLALDMHHHRVPVTLPPASNATFAAYATAFTRRYGLHGTFWAANPSLPYEPVVTFEVWNEEDEAMSWGPRVDLQSYARMYETVRSAIRRVEPHAQVMTGGVAWTITSLPRLLKAFERKPLDAVAIHPYASTPNGTVALVRYAFAQMRRFHRSRTALVANEYGWTSTQGTWGSISPAKVDGYAYQTLVRLARLHVAFVLPFEWADATWGLSNGTFARALTTVLHRNGA